MLCKNATNECDETIFKKQLFKLVYEAESISKCTMGISCHAEL